MLVKKGLMSGRLRDGIDVASDGDPIDAAMRFIYAAPGVSSAIVGTINIDHLRSDVEAATRALASR